MSASIDRIVDANANRAREALRVLEDYARFVLDDGELSSAYKSMRHELRGIVELIGIGVVEAHRRTDSDVGRTISTREERCRAGVADVVVAAAKRLTEALRAVEEYGKIHSEAVGASAEALRYRAYELETALLRRIGQGVRRQWRVCVLISESLCKLPWLDVVDAALTGGADCIQLREKELPDGKLLGRATAVVQRCHEAGAAAIINDRIDVALLSGADGVHLGQEDMPCEFARRLSGRRLLIGVSTSTIVQAQAALRMGADYCGVGPMFATSTKVKTEIVGPAYLRSYVHSMALPHLAIGGITPDRVPELLQAGAQGIAVSSAICASDHPKRITEEFVTAMRVLDLDRTTPVNDGGA